MLSNNDLVCAPARSSDPTPLHSTPPSKSFPSPLSPRPAPARVSWPAVSWAISQASTHDLGHRGHRGNRNGNQKVRRGPWVFSAQTSRSVSWSDAHLTCDVMGTRCHSCLCPQLSFVSPAAAPVSHPVQCPELPGSDDGVIQYKVFYSTLEKKHELF